MTGPNPSTFVPEIKDFRKGLKIKKVQGQRSFAYLHEHGFVVVAVVRLWIGQFLRRYLYLIEGQLILTPIVINNIDQVSVTGRLEKHKLKEKYFVNKLRKIQT
jgi:hypothetical protein